MMFYKLIRNFRFITAIFLFILINLNYAIARDENLTRIELETGIQGWKYLGACKGGNNNFHFQLDYYHPPGNRDIGGYGIIRINHHGDELVYSGFNLSPYGRENDDCVNIVIGENLLILHTDDWSAAERYIVSINPNRKTKEIFGYNLKRTVIYEKQISDGVYLIAGFGVCKKPDSTGNWIFDEFCEKIDKNKLNSARKYLESATGLKLSPSISGVGDGIFNYHVICDGFNQANNESVDNALRDYLTTVQKKIKADRAKGTKENFYGSLLSMASLSVHAPQLAKEFPIDTFLENSDDRQVIKTAFQKYWNIIFDKK